MHLSLAGYSGSWVDLVRVVNNINLSVSETRKCLVGVRGVVASVHGAAGDRRGRSDYPSDISSGNRRGLALPERQFDAASVANGRTDEGEEETLREDRRPDHENPQTGQCERLLAEPVLPLLRLVAVYQTMNPLLGLVCPILVAARQQRGARSEASTAPETIGPDTSSLLRSQSITEESAAVDEPIKPDQTG